MSELSWRKAPASCANGHCIELARLQVGVAVRDSKNPAGPRLRFGRAEWVRFASEVKAR